MNDMELDDWLPEDETDEDIYCEICGDHVDECMCLEDY